MGFDQAEKETVIEDIHKHVVHTPYKEYPRHLHKAGGATLIVEDDKTKAKALRDGWQLQPVVDADKAEKAPSAE